MKIGVIADIHGNLQALEAIVSDALKKKVEAFIIAGDLVADCAEPNEVVEVVKRLKAYVIKGNREEYIQSYLEGKQLEWNDYEQMASVVWTANQLTDDNYQYLCNLPVNRVINFYKKGKIGIVHGSPFHISQHLYADKEQDVLQKAVDEMSVDVLIAGHSHTQWKKNVSGTLVLNPGAAGVHFNEQKGAEYAILEYKDNKWEAYHYIVEYDLSIVEERMKEKGLYDVSRIWSELIVYSIRNGVNANIEFLSTCTDVIDELGYIPNILYHERGNRWLRQH